MKRITLLVSIFVFLLFTAESCFEGTPSSDTKLNQQQEQMMKEANAQTGMPAITHFQERKLLKTILELRDQENLVCYAYLFSEMTGKLVFIGKCIGYGIPYSTEFTNPQKLENPYSEQYIAMPQADPNGLFMPASAEGTWLQLLDQDGKPHPVYIEPRCIVSPFPLKGELQ